MKKSEKTLTYSAAHHELKEILSELEGEEIDVDDLSARVKRAADLIGFCQERLQAAETDVKRVVERFEKEQAADE